MTVTPQTIRELSLSGQFDTLSDGQLQPFIDEASLHLSATAWGARYDKGLALLAAHLIVSEQAGGASSSPGLQTVTSERLGPASRSYAVATPNSPSDDPLRLQSTTFGQRYLMLLDLLPISPTSAWGIT